MKLGQLKRKVIKEFGRSPAKTIFLIALCPVALYFVVPLFLPAKSQGDPSQRAKVIAPNLAPSTTPVASFAAVVPLSQGPTWQQLNDWMAADSRRAPGRIAEDQRNPFQEPLAEVEVVAVSEGPEEAHTPGLSREDFETLGLKLTGTLVGRHSRSASINGRRYLEGALVTPRPAQRSATQPSTAQQETFLLKHVGARHAILEKDGMRFRLELNASQPLADGITVVRGQASPPN